MTAVEQDLDRAREAFANHAWGDARTLLVAADDRAPLGPDDLERLARAAYLVGRDDESADAWTRAHKGWLRDGDPVRAARSAFWLAIGLLLGGEMAQSGGWLARAQRLLDDAGQEECVERGYLLVPAGLESMATGDAATAHATFARAEQIGVRCAEPDLLALARLGQGQALILGGDTARGLVLFDEVMVAATAWEISPIVVGLVYCAVIEACHDLLDLGRAQEWTAALSRWCAAQPDLVPYRGQCLVHRAQILQLHGAWADAVEQAQLACEVLAGRPAAGMALYQRAELHRLHGEFAEATDRYREASQCGQSPQPGLARLRLAEGHVGAAEAAIRLAAGAVDGSASQSQSQLLAAAVEILLAARDVPAARTAADELAGIAAERVSPFLRALSATATGSVLLAEGDASAALAASRQSWMAWRELGAPYESACARVLAGLACRALGDDETAEMELDAARCAFDQLGAAPDLARVAALAGTAPPVAIGSLTPREAEVLALLATGKTNRAIAAELFISEKTVARHVSNIFTKLGISSRSAATAYAYEHRVVSPSAENCPHR